MLEFSKIEDMCNDALNKINNNTNNTTNIPDTKDLNLEEIKIEKNLREEAERILNKLNSNNSKNNENIIKEKSLSLESSEIEKLCQENLWL